MAEGKTIHRHHGTQYTDSYPPISVIIPNRNGAGTIGRCLEAVYSSEYVNYEVIVVDDCSTDNSVEIIKQYPCKLVQLQKHGGASRARNVGVENASHNVLFFIDSDCVMFPDTLQIAGSAYQKHPMVVVGGTYTPLPYDKGFFSTFQSVFVHYSETKLKVPDYVATHAMLMSKKLFVESGGFNEDFLPILEDVEFSHRLKHQGITLLMYPGLTVQHIFNFTLMKSLKNAVKKSMYWTMYSIRNRDLLSDSGTASKELKMNTVLSFLCLVFAVLFLMGGNGLFLLAATIVFIFNLLVNRKFIGALHRAGGPFFTLRAVFYYTSLYPAAVGTGGLMGVMRRK